MSGRIRLFSALSIKSKLVAITLATSVLATGLVSLAFMTALFVSISNNMIESGTTMAKMLASDTAAAVAFQDRKTAVRLLSSCQADPKVISARIFEMDGRIFAFYVNRERQHRDHFNQINQGTLRAWKPVRGKYLPLLFADYLVFSWPVVVNERKLAILQLAVDPGSLKKTLFHICLFTLLTLVLATIAAVLLSFRLHRAIAGPVEALSATVESVRRKKDYTLRARRFTNDELGVLTDGFNSMLDTIDRQNKELRQARDAAEEASRFKSLFLANMSHEIRTPMNAILGMTELALGTSLDATQKTYLKTVRASADMLLSLLNDILDFSKIESGQLSVEQHPFDLRDTLDLVMQSLALPAHEKGLELLCQVDPGIPVYLTGDSLRLRQIVTNLVSNAIKFSSQGAVVTRVMPVAGNPELFHFSVTDSGIGISREKQEIIFQSFRQADDSTGRLHGGTGLGLAISKKLTELMGGEIWVESQEGVGSTFHFTLCLRPADQEEEWEGFPVDPASVRVLIVSSNVTGTNILEGMLQMWGFPCFTAASAAMAFMALRKAEEGEPFGLLLVEDNLADQGGQEMIRELRNQVDLPPVLLLSAQPDADRVRWCRENQCHYLGKPVRRQELRDTLAALLGDREAGESGEEASGFSSAGRERLKILLVEDNAFNRDLARIVLEEQGHQVEEADNGYAALEYLGRSGFDVIFMDIQMPEMDGLTAIRIIRACEENRPPGHDLDPDLLAGLRHRLRGTHLPLVALTAHAMKGDRENCLRAGADEYLTKPFSGEDLASVLDRITTFS